MSLNNEKGKVVVHTRPVVLVVLDGWGINPSSEGNAIALAQTPAYTSMWNSCPHATLSACGADVGLHDAQFGNSEAGHLNIGAGRIVLQDAVRISRAISNGSFFKNPVFKQAVEHVRKNNSTLHLMGLLSSRESAHSNPDHLLALLAFVRVQKLKKVVLHLFTDGRDSPRYAAIQMLKQIERFMGDIKVGSIVGRYYAMDRAKHWDRIEQAYDMLTGGEGLKAQSADHAILQSYNRNESDEFIKPTIILKNHDEPMVVKDHDAVIFFNLRSDRARQLTRAFIQHHFPFFKRKVVLKDLFFVGMTEFGPDLSDMKAAYPTDPPENTLPMVLKEYRQLYIAESEKYAHITFFFNGGYDHPVGGEDRIIIPSPKVPTYDLRPAMSTLRITRTVQRDLEKSRYDFFAINIAAPDMVAHTGNLQATIKAVEAVDKCLGDLKASVEKAHGFMLITADHGNAEEVLNTKTGEVNTEHSPYPVPFILFGDQLPKPTIRDHGRLGDIAPTILDLFGIEKPHEMTGESLFS